MRTERSREDYLEAILAIETKRGEVRNVDVAEYLDFSKPSVSRAMSLLCEEGMVVINDERRIQLTKAGREVAERVSEKHRFFTEMLEQAGVVPDRAATEACRIEHAISDEAFVKVKKAYKEHFMAPGAKMDG